MKAVAVLRNPWVRTLSAFHDYIRMGRIKTSVGTPQGMEELISGKIWLVQSGERNLEDFDVRILTSGVYIHGLRAWSTWSSSQLYVVRSEDMFERTADVLSKIQRFLGLSEYHWSPSELKPRNKNIMRRAFASASLNRSLDDFFVPYNEELYAWMSSRRIPFGRWENATPSSGNSAPSLTLSSTERFSQLHVGL
eukprot:CAMPEP_0181171320 /NCGR_PEP_ID=MMETSP1096-20121128/1843_1 /TAXON_ID=156174 ORGANISM="Chrysochromulina ericina, Strain CCMP281" /NCGR_SAMPLE_ID=MMETSP1096 /ASSEMBLY_ACC=CAM_ASM_000453 /LENGTH=193 /DNA_ID=CAMNT_0023258953 /DNA_START=67 /DNA_END=648 /DNA_ORIENTATION=-